MAEWGTPGRSLRRLSSRYERQLFKVVDWTAAVGQPPAAAWPRGTCGAGTRTVDAAASNVAIATSLTVVGACPNESGRFVDAAASGRVTVPTPTANGRRASLSQ